MYKNTCDDALYCDVVHPVLGLPVARLHGLGVRLEVDVESGVICGRRTHCVVRDAPVHTAVFLVDVSQIQYAALFEHKCIVSF